MIAELAHVEGSTARWRFALGCLRVVLTSQRPTVRAGSAWLAVGALMVLWTPIAIAPASWSARMGWLAGESLVSVSLVGAYLAVLVWPTVTSATPPNGGHCDRWVRSIAYVGLAGASVLDTFALLRYPELRSEGASGRAGYVATGIVTVTVFTIIAWYAHLAITGTRDTSPQATNARRYGLVAGCISGPLLVVATIGPTPVLFWAGAATCAVLAGRFATRRAGAPRDGLTAGLWAGTTAGLVLFVGGAGLALVTHSHSYSAALLADFHASHFRDLHSFAIATTLGLDGDPPLLGALVPLVIVPLLATGLATFGATNGGLHLTQRPPTPTPRLN